MTMCDCGQDHQAPYQDEREQEAVNEISKTHPSREGRDPWEALAEWWTDTATDEAEGIVRKAKEYGGAKRANDLVEVGRALCQAGVSPGETPDNPAYLAELGCYFYIVGKMARYTAAISEGRRVSDDTLHDIGIYVRMIQRIRQVGGWPV